MQQPFGYDYGTKPKVMVVGDGKFPSLLDRSFMALGYGQVPHFGILVNAPLLAMMFNNEHIGRECFTHFKNWTEGSRDGDAIGISFIEFEGGEYGMCTFQEHKRLINRYLPERERAEVDPLLMTVGHLKIFGKQNDSYRWFKQSVKTSPCVVALATEEGDVLLEYAFWKRKIHFYHEHEVPEQTVENSLLRSRNANEATEQKYPIPPELRPQAQNISRYRQAQLARFFPVTLELLHFNSLFRQTKQALIDKGYQEWQVMQAGCNIALQNRLPALFITNEAKIGEDKDGSIKMRILGFLLNQREDLSVMLPPEETLSKTKLLNQICADSYDLLSYIISPDTPEVAANEIQQELVKRGFITAR